MSESLQCPREQALDILHHNDRGEYSVPTHGLYPVQFNWDSAFAALGYQVLDEARAFREIELLLSAQWTDGMVPHIIFRGEHDGYFPGPDVWATGQPIPTSGITQPPVAASLVMRLLRLGYNPGYERKVKAARSLESWHTWFTHARQDDQGAIYVIHPWESGRDNVPDWDTGMMRIELDTGLGDYKRRDLEHVDAAQRPTKEEYDRYLTIVHYGRKVGWDQEELGRSSPFRMACAGMTAMLLASERDLRELLVELEMSTNATDARIAKLEEGWRSLWNPKVRAFTSRNITTGEISDSLTSVAFLGPYAGMYDHLGAMMDHFDRIGSKVKFMLPSFDPDCAGFDAKRYWRGPVWFVVNNRVGIGLERIGEKDRANRIKENTRTLAEMTGFYEYYDPFNGEGLGGRNFTWTASVYLDWILRD